MRALFVCLLLIAGAALSAQPEISLEYPVGTVVNHTGSVNLGDNPDRNPHNLTVRIRNLGSTDLTLDTSTTERPVELTGASGVNWIRTQPAASVVSAGSFIDFTMTLTPNAKGNWSVLMSVYSDDPTNNPYQISFRGSAGKEDEDDDCSTGEGSGGWLILLAALSAAVVGTRLRAAR